MANRHSSRKGKNTAGQNVYLKLLAVLAVVLILAAVILLTGRKPRIEDLETGQFESNAPVTLAVETESSRTEAETQTESSSETEESTEEAAQVKLTKDGVSEITKLAQSYFQAKQSADAETMYQLFGRTDTDGMEKLRESLQYSSRYTENYQNVAAYTMEGLTADSYLVYISYDLKFRDCETLAPGLFWTYVTKNADGNYCMTEMSDITQDVLGFVNEAEQSEAVYELRTGIYDGLRAAMEKDSQLAELYAILLGTAQPEEETTAVSHEIRIGEVTETTVAAESAEGTEITEEESQTEGPANAITAGETSAAGQQ